MTQPGKWRWLYVLSLLLAMMVNSAHATITPEVDKVLQQGFPQQPEALANTTTALFAEYTRKKTVASLIFYSYGLLRQAKSFSTVNDFIHAAEYAKTGLFYLDEAVDANEDNLRVRYLRARIDAYLSADMGRCVVTLQDTEQLLAKPQLFDNDLVNHIRYMRYRALMNCNEHHRANLLLEKIKVQGTLAANYLTLDSTSAPDWNMHEVMQIVMPLLKGE